MSQERVLESSNEFSDETFGQLDLAEGFVSGKSFVRCEFRKCLLFETHLVNCRFEQCKFVECDLSMATVEDSIFLDVGFDHCKLMGVNWSIAKHLHVLQLHFKECTLNYCTFFGMDLQNVRFAKCIAHGVNFGEANLTAVKFNQTDLKDADFLHTDLTGADFRTAKRYSIHPANNMVKGAKFSFPEALSLLKAFELEIDLETFDPE